MSLRATCQFFLILISVVFEAVREGQGVSCYSILCIEEVYLRSFIYFCMEHFIIISLAVMVWQNSQKPEDIKTDRFFVLLCMLDFVDYLVTGNNVWEKLPLTYSENSWFFILPFSMNVLMVLCFGLYSHRQWKISNGNQ